MLTLITGTPGSGKTLYTLNYVKGKAEKENRTVYYSGIRDLTLPWQLFGLPNGDAARAHETDPSNWHELPDGSIIVIDECQRLFRPRGTGAVVPQYVAALETHRHKGLDIFLVTQHPMLIDSNIRRLVGQHFHVVRRFGGQKAVIHEWSSCTEISKSAIGEAVRHDFSYPAESFQWYKSAEVHTHKRRIPARVYFMWAAPVLVIGLIALGYQRLSHYVTGPSPSASAAGRIGDDGSVRSGRTSSSSATAKPSQTSEEYVAARLSRVPGLEYSAPLYDDVTKVTRAPVPVSCVAGVSRCQCYSQDATRMSVPEDLCRAIVRDGFFVAFDRGPNGYGSPSPIGVAPDLATAAGGGPPRGTAPASAPVSEVMPLARGGSPQGTRLYGDEPRGFNPLAAVPKDALGPSPGPSSARGGGTVAPYPPGVGPRSTRTGV